MHYLVPAPLMSRIAEFLEDYPGPTALRLKADLVAQVRPVPAPPEGAPGAHAGSRRELQSESQGGPTSADA
jgi:hypothetical protein